MSDLKCPYCGHENEVCHDDGEGYEEDTSHQMQCDGCDKYFVFQTSILFHYKPSKADCLNDGEHTYVPTNTYPRDHTKMRCTQCDNRRQPTKAEMKIIMENKS